LTNKNLCAKKEENQVIPLDMALILGGKEAVVIKISPKSYKNPVI